MFYVLMLNNQAVSTLLFMFVFIFLIKFWVTEWPPIGKIAAHVFLV